MSCSPDTVKNTFSYHFPICFVTIFLKEKLKIKILYAFITKFPIQVASYKTYYRIPARGFFFWFQISSATVREATPASRSTGVPFTGHFTC